MSKLFYFTGHRNPMTMDQFIDLHVKSNTLKKKITDHSFKYNRRKFNNMTYSEQREYDLKLAKPCYNVVTPEGIYYKVTKKVYDSLYVPLAG